MKPGVAGDEKREPGRAEEFLRTFVDRAVRDVDTKLPVE